jgi:hypothetical protein
MSCRARRHGAGVEVVGFSILTAGDVGHDTDRVKNAAQVRKDQHKTLGKLMNAGTAKKAVQEDPPQAAKA